MVVWINIQFTKDYIDEIRWAITAIDFLCNGTQIGIEASQKYTENINTLWKMLILGIYFLCLTFYGQ